MQDKRHSTFNDDNSAISLNDRSFQSVSDYKTNSVEHSSSKPINFAFADRCQNINKNTNLQVKTSQSHSGLTKQSNSEVKT